MRALLLIAAIILVSTPAEARRHHHYHHRHHQHYDHQESSFVAALPHPAGCPARLFCGCGVSVDVFGHPVRSLYLAIEWARRFPKTQAAEGMVAARNGHVMRLRSHVSGDVWMVYDPNGGRGGTWLHARSIRGYIIVNPLGGR